MRIGSALACGTGALILSQQSKRRSMVESFRIVVILVEVLSVPYFVFFWFGLPALRSASYRRRWIRCFGRDSLAPAPSD